MYAAQRIEAIVNSLEGDQPLFLMAHLVPPHSPDTPPEAYRLWSDPDYDGPCDGTNSYLGSIRGFEDVSPEDLKELVALYDGNLRFCDAAVEWILKSLETKGRLEHAIVVVTADHGEAFFEHGKRSHNSTIFDEMLHVPLFVRLPRGVESEGVDLDRLISLEDLTPTLLGLVGGNPSSRTTGVDLFSDPPRLGLLLRTDESHGVLGFRSERWKLIADRQGRFDQLYDLKADEHEQSNVILRYPGVVSAMAARWARAESMLPPRLDIVDAGMTDRERDMLRQLGYLDSEPEVQRPEGS
jgi:arylsulfatase A-like enzyme